MNDQYDAIAAGAPVQLTNGQFRELLDRASAGTHGTPLTLSVTATASRMGLPRKIVGILIKRGEIHYIAALRPDGQRSRVHKHVIQSSVDAWLANNAIKSPEDLRKATDGRRTHRA